jgi:hypothetical protein
MKPETARGLRWKSRRLLVLSGVLFVILALALPTFVLGWAPLLHYSCEASGPVATATFSVPLSILNTPYGGEGFVNSTIPMDLFGNSPNANPPNFVRGWEANGTIWGAFYKTNLTVYSDSNATSWGPGSNMHCSNPFILSLRLVSPGQGYEGAIFAWPGAPMFGPNSTSDHLEPDQLNFSSAPGDSTPFFSNGFSGENAENITTCGGPEKRIPMQSDFIRILISFGIGGEIQSQPVVLPFTQNFDYVFPANFGTWQVDNLSAPGGPGGG